MSEVWRCAGCGIEGPDTDRRCGCATSVVVSSVCKKTGEWKTGPSHHQWNTRADLPPTLSAAMELPEVKELMEAMERAIEAIDAAYDGPDDNGAYTVRERAALAALVQPTAQAQINWATDPDAIVEDDEPQIGRDYA